MLNRQLLRKLKLTMNFISNLGGPTNTYNSYKRGYMGTICIHAALQ